MKFDLSFIIFYAVTLVLIYIVVESAVRSGINKSVLGRKNEKQIGNEDSKNASFDSDLHQ